MAKSPFEKSTPVVPVVMQLSSLCNQAIGGGVGGNALQLKSFPAACTPETQAFHEPALAL
jgi:hypothetical protein